MKKRKGRYQNSEKKTTGRAYMSYEDVPLKDYGYNDPAPEHLTKKFFKGFFIVIVAVLAVLIVTNIDRFTPENISHWIEYDLLGKSEGDGYPTEITGTTISSGNFGIMNGVPVYCSDSSIVVLNSNAGNYQESRHAFANPILKTNSAYSIVYNVNATGFSILNRDSIVYTSTASNKIFSADVAPNGVYAILTHSDDYLSKLTVYRNDNLERYTYSFVDFYVNNVSINKDGSRAVVSGVSANNGGLVSALYVIDFSQEKFMQKYDFDDVYIYDLVYLENGNAVAVGDKAAYYVNIQDGKREAYSYRSDTLIAYALSRSTGASIAVSENPDGSSCEVFSINAKGESTSRFDTGKKVLSIDGYADKTAVLFADGIVVYDTKGNILFSANVPTDARKLCMSDHATVYALGKSRIYQVILKK